MSLYIGASRRLIVTCVPIYRRIACNELRNHLAIHCTFYTYFIKHLLQATSLEFCVVLKLSCFAYDYTTVCTMISVYVVFAPAALIFILLDTVQLCK